MKFKDSDEQIEHLFGSLLENDEYIAQELETTARAFEQKAESLRQWAERQRRKKHNWRDLMQTVKQIPAAYAQAVEDRSNDPILHVAEVLNMKPEMVTAWLDVYTKREVQHSREKRNREIVQLARRGLTNKEIAMRMKLNPRTIQRIIKAQFRDLGQRATTSSH